MATAAGREGSGHEANSWAKGEGGAWIEGRGAQGKGLREAG